MAEPDAAGLQAADPAGRGPDARGVSGRDQPPAGAPRPGNAVRRGGRQRHGEPGLAQVPALAKAGVQSDWEAWQKRDLAHDDIVRVILDGTVVSAGLEAALSALWPTVPVQRCTVHKHRNLLAHAP